MPFLFDRKKRWKDLETVKNADLNGELDNIINEAGIDQISGWSQSVAQMKLQTTPGAVGTESLSNNTSGELERLRYQLGAIIGASDSLWYNQPPISLTQVNSFLAGSGGLPHNRIVSGRIDGNNQPMFLVPAGSSNKVTLKCTATPFVIYINNTPYTFSTDIDFTGLGQPAATQNTFAIDDATNADGSAITKNFGDYIADLSSNLADGSDKFFQDYTLVGKTCGSNIASLVGTYQAFKYVHGGSTEYFVGYISAAAGGGAINLRNCFRGYFLDSGDTSVPAIALTDSETVTLMKIAWMFLQTNGTLLPCYTNPRVSASQPTTFSSGDMWYDTVNQKWKQSNGSSYNDIAVHLVGICITNGTNCVAARSFDFYKIFEDTSNVVVEKYSTTEYRAKHPSNVISVYGNLITIDKDYFRWDTTNNLESGTTLSSGNTYFLYVSDTGVPYVSKYFPHKRSELGGYYHPFKPWRCVAFALYNSAGEFDSNVMSMATTPVDTGAVSKDLLSHLVPTGTILHYGGVAPPSGFLICDGASYTRSSLSNLFRVIGTKFGSVDSTHFNVPDIRGRFLRGWDHGAGNDPNAGSRVVSASGGATADSIGTYQADGFKQHLHTFTTNNGAAGAGNGPVGNASGSGLQTGSTDNTGGDETRPKNVYAQVIIKT